MTASGWCCFTGRACLVSHLGTDTIGLKRQGAGRVVGVDLSGESLRRARELAAECGADIEYVESNVYDARAAVDARAGSHLVTGALRLQAAVVE